MVALLFAPHLAYVPSLVRAPLPSLPKSPVLLRRRHPAPLAADVGSVAEPANTAVLTDTLLDIGVYGLLALVVALTLYSLVVTLQKSNEEYGGWTPRDDEEITQAARSDDGRLRAGARYDPVTEQWTYPDAAEQRAAKVGRAPAAAASSPAADDPTNRYDRRMLKKRKKANKRSKK